jgi:hypothetical protein
VAWAVTTNVIGRETGIAGSGGFDNPSAAAIYFQTIQIDAIQAMDQEKKIENLSYSVHNGLKGKVRK